MRTSAWVGLLLALGGCTSNGIFLETATDDGTGGTDGTSEGTQTSPPAESGSSDTGVPECVEDYDCGDCAECVAGVCEYYDGCCAAPAEGEWQWRCSPPECWDDVDCGEGMICDGGFCQPGPGPNTQVIEPPLCRGDVALSVEELALELPLSHVAVAEAGGAWGLGVDLGALRIDLAAGPSAPVGLFQGTAGVDLLGAGPETIVGIVHDEGADGAIEHAIGRAWASGGAAELAQGSFTAGGVQTAVWAAGLQELWVGSGRVIERWDVQTLEWVGGVGPLGTEVRAVGVVEPPGGGPTLMAYALDDGAVRLFDPTSTVPEVTSDVLAGRTVDLLGHGASVLVVTNIEGDAVDEANRTGIHRVDEVNGSLVAAPAFGVTGYAREAALVDVDGNGVDDVLLANDDGRLDVLFMEADGPSCRIHLPLADIADIEAGDVNGDGARDLLVLHAGPMVTALHGAAP